MVCAHANRVRGALEVVSPYRERRHDGEQLLLVHRISRLGAHHLLGHERHRLQAVAVVLLQHRADCVAGCVAVHDEFLGWVRQDENRRRLQRALQIDECFLFLGPPRQLQLLSCHVARELRERQRDRAEVAHEPAVVTGEAEKCAELAYVLRSRPVAHRFDLVLHDAQAVHAHHVAEEFYLSLAQRALAGLGVQPLLAQAIQRLPHVLFMLLQRVAVHDDVVQEDEHEFVEEVCEGVVHQLHEDAWRVAQSHRQHVVFEQALRRGERCLVAVQLVDKDLIEARTQVDLGKVFGLCKLVEQLVRARQRVPVFDRNGVERAKVGDRSIFSSCRCLRLLDVKVWSCILRLALGNQALVQHVLQPLRLERRVLLVDSRRYARWWLGSWRELDVQLVSAPWRQSCRQVVHEHVTEFLEQPLAHARQLRGVWRCCEWRCLFLRWRRDSAAVVVRRGEVSDFVLSARATQQLVECAPLPCLFLLAVIRPCVQLCDVVDEQLGLRCCRWRLLFRFLNWKLHQRHPVVFVPRACSRNTHSLCFEIDLCV